MSTDMTTLDCHVSSTKRGVFLDGNGKMGVSSMKMAGFMDTHIKMSLLSTKRPRFVDETGQSKVVISVDIS